MSGFAIFGIDHMSHLSGDKTSFRGKVTTFQNGIRTTSTLVLFNSLVQPDNRVWSPHGFMLIFAEEGFTKFGVLSTFPLLGCFPNNDAYMLHYIGSDIEKRSTTNA
jgi:hypothetical protein